MHTSFLYLGAISALVAFIIYQSANAEVHGRQLALSAITKA